MKMSTAGDDEFTGIPSDPEEALTSDIEYMKQLSHELRTKGTIRLKANESQKIQSVICDLIALRLFKFNKK